MAQLRSSTHLDPSRYAVAVSLGRCSSFGRFPLVWSEAHSHLGRVRFADAPIGIKYLFFSPLPFVSLREDHAFLMNS